LNFCTKVTQLPLLWQQWRFKFVDLWRFWHFLRNTFEEFLKLKRGIIIRELSFILNVLK
jgi:hypothetical protein